MQLAQPGQSRITGAGVGLRNPHFSYIEQERPSIPWFEVLIDNYFGGGSALQHLETIRMNYAMTFHGVGMSLGGTDALDKYYLARLKKLVERFQPQHVSDHICWTGIHGRQLHELLPLPYTEETVRHVAERILRVQDYLGQRILIENVSSYLNYRHSEMSEWDFVNAISAQADCYILFDVNNVYVSAANHGFDALEYVRAMQKARVREIHLAGYEDQGAYLLDTHSRPVHGPVWALYETTIKQLGAVPTLIEWDNDLPVFETLAAEARKAQAVLNRYQLQKQASEFRHVLV